MAGMGFEQQQSSRGFESQSCPYYVFFFRLFCNHHFYSYYSIVQQCGIPGRKASAQTEGAGGAPGIGFGSWTRARGSSGSDSRTGQQLFYGVDLIVKSNLFYFVQTVSFNYLVKFRCVRRWRVTRREPSARLRPGRTASSRRRSQSACRTCFLRTPSNLRRYSRLLLAYLYIRLSPIPKVFSRSLQVLLIPVHRMYILQMY